MTLREAWARGMIDGRAVRAPLRSTPVFRTAVALAALASGLPAQLVLNEVLARNLSGIVDEAGEREDWIEIWNDSLASIDLSGKFLTDDFATSPQQWVFPTGTSIAPGSAVLVWADGDLGQGPLHASFELDADNGGAVWLVDTDGATVLDTLAFGYQLADVSTARVFDAGLPWVTIPAPTPRTANSPVQCGVRRYSALEPWFQSLELDVAGRPGLGETVDIEIFEGPPASLHAVFFGGLPAELQIGLRSRLLLAPPLAPGTIGLSGGFGMTRFPFVVPVQPGLVGLSIYVQAWTFENNEILGSNGVEMIFCP